MFVVSPVRKSFKCSVSSVQEEVEAGGRKRIGDWRLEISSFGALIPVHSKINNRQSSIVNPRFLLISAPTGRRGGPQKKDLISGPCPKIIVVKSRISAILDPRRTEAISSS
jgi:hypothetical protein